MDIAGFLLSVLEFFKSLSPIFLIIIGAVLFFFSGAVKWLAKVAGALMVIYGIMLVAGVVAGPPPVENIENALGGLSCLAF